MSKYNWRTFDGWVVGLEQTNKREPFEWVTLEYFYEEDDALNFARTWMLYRAGYQLSRRTWCLTTDEVGMLRLKVRRNWSHNHKPGEMVYPGPERAP